MLSLFEISRKPIVLAASLSVFFCNLACSNHSGSELTVFKALDESLRDANITIRKSTETIYASLEQKLADPTTALKAQIWCPKATMVQKHAGDITTYIENLKHQLKEAAGLKKKDDKEMFEEIAREVVNDIFNKQGMGDSLYQKLIAFKRDILSVDNQMNTAFRQTLLLTTKTFDQSISDPHDFTKTFFDNTPVVAALATLSKFQNNVRILENRMLAFCNNKMTYHTCGFYDVYSAIIGQKSTYLKPAKKWK